jgi:8-hydroxy-5-deazaflavin:NADPH oxidoreductase
MSARPSVGIVGAGRVGTALGERLAEVGHEVLFGQREGSQGELDALLARLASKARATSVAEAAQAEVVFVAVPTAALPDVARAIAGDLGEHILVDCTNPVGPGPSLASPAEGSNAALLARLLPGARIVKGFNTFGAEHHRTASVAGASVDVALASDDAEAKRIVSAIAEGAGFRPLDAGPLANAALLEAMAVLWIHLAMKGGLGRNVAWKLLGS